MGLAIGSCGGSGFEESLVRRGAAPHAWPYPGEIGSIDQDVATQAVAHVARVHHAARLLLQHPRGPATEGELPHLRQRGQPGLRQAEEVDSEKPCAPRSPGSVKCRPGGGRGLVSAGGALHKRTVLRCRGGPVALRAVALHAAEADTPLDLRHGSGALFFATVTLDVLAHDIQNWSWTPLIGMATTPQNNGVRLPNRWLTR